MRWTDTQRALLQEMGIRLWPAWPGTEAPTSASMPEAVTAVGAPTAPVVPPAPLRPPVSMAAPTAAPKAALPSPERSAVTRPDRSLLPAAARVSAPVSTPVASQVVAPVTFTPPAAARWPAGTPELSADWSALRAEVAACRACGLCESRTQPVFGVGHPQAHWMLVGEAPGEQEDLQGEPFVGKSGQLLDNMLRAVGLTRSDTGAGGAPTTPERQVYIANVLKCRPPANRNPQPDEVARCEPFLRRQVALVQPRIILAMGRFAVQSLLKTQEPIGRLRGRVHQYEGVPVVVTYHPAYLLRNPLDKVRSWEDLCLALEVMRGEGPEVTAPPPSLI
jgi:uracil-DNA glycosylase